MDLDRFWELVEAAAVAGDVDCEAQAERLTAMLQQLAPEEIASLSGTSRSGLPTPTAGTCGGWPTSSTVTPHVPVPKRRRHPRR